MLPAHFAGTNKLLQYNCVMVNLPISVLNVVQINEKYNEIQTFAPCSHYCSGVTGYPQMEGKVKGCHDVKQINKCHNTIMCTACHDLL